MDETPLSHADAKAQCQSLHHNGYIFEPRTADQQRQIEAYLSMKSSDGTLSSIVSQGIHIGMCTESTGKTFLWDKDETSVFTTSIHMFLKCSTLQTNELF